MVIQALIAAYCRPERLELTLDGLRRVNVPCGDKLDILVVDDGSEPPLVELCGKYDADCIRHCRNLGTSAARRTLYSQATGDFIWTLDSDMYPDPNCIARYLEVVEKGVAGCGRMNKMEDVEADYVINIDPEYRILFLLKNSYPEHRHDWPSDKTARADRPWEWAFTGNLFFYGDDFRAGGGVPHEFKNWGHDDTVLVWNVCKKTPMKFVCCNSAQTWHIQSDRVRLGNSGNTGSEGYNKTALENAERMRVHVEKNS